MYVLSLFDGISVGQLALEESGIDVTQYFASEIDKSAIKVTQNRFPETIQLGDVSNVRCKYVAIGYGESPHSKIIALTGDVKRLLIAGTPCQGLSNEGTGLNFKHKGSKLFYEFVRILKEFRPDYFFLENVWMKKQWADIITKELGVEPILIDSQLVSAQKRRRYYWTNIPDVKQPVDCGTRLSDVLINIRNRFYNEIPIENSGIDFKYDLYPNIQIKEATKIGYCIIKPSECFDYNFPKSKTRRGRLMANKSNCITATRQNWYQYVRPGFVRKITINEIEALQTLPIDYTNQATEAQRFKMVGNSWNKKTIVHIFKNIAK